jgi:hypothetical protein
MLQRKVTACPTRRDAAMQHATAACHGFMQPPGRFPAAAAARTSSESEVTHVGFESSRLPASPQQQGRVPVRMWPSRGADVAESRCRCGRVPVQMWPSRGADVAESRRRCGRVAVQMWPLLLLLWQLRQPIDAFVFVCV